jgi:hypothetical protein
MTTETAPRNYDWVRHLLPRIVIGALIAAALVAVYAVIIGRFDETCWRLIGTICLFVFFSLVSWYDADVSARRAAWFGAVSVVTSAYLLIAGLAKIWIPVDYEPNPPWWEPFAWVFLVVVTRVGLLHIHLVLNTQRRFTGPIMSKVTVVTLVLVGLLTVGLSLPLIFTRTDFGETYWRLVAVIAILDVLGTILIPLTYSLFGPKAAKPGVGGGVQLGAAPVYAQPGMGSGGVAPVPASAAAPAAAAGANAAAPAPASRFVPAPTAAYPTLFPQGGLRLEWPRYINGAPLPAKPDGTPDFTGVVGFGA